MFGTLDYTLLDDFIHTNVAGPLKITETFIANVEASKQKKIVAISSAAASVFVPPEEAIGKMIETIDALALKDTGRFLDNDGKDHPW